VDKLDKLDEQLKDSLMVSVWLMLLGIGLILLGLLFGGIEFIIEIEVI
jgi:hypothetical protein